MFEKVLIPIDFSADTGSILETVARFPGVREAFLIHVVDATHPSKTGWKHGPEIEGAKIQLEELAGKLQGAHIAARTRVDTITSGDISHTIMAAARREGAPLVVMGARGLGRLSDLLLGSVSSTMLRIADRPILVVRVQPVTCQPPAPILAKVLVPTDFSAPADAALAAVKGLSGIGEIVLAHVVIDGGGEAEVAAEIKDAEGRLARIRETLRRSGINASVHIHVGPTAQEIVKMADEEDATLIAISTHGRGRIGELILGSTAHDVANHATRPLLVIPARWTG
jgi:nucleotide-binding universal stress UspA family protein